MISFQLLPSLGTGLEEVEVDPTSQLEAETDPLLKLRAVHSCRNSRHHGMAEKTYGKHS